MTSPTAPKPPSIIQLTWDGERRFDAGRPGGPTMRIDGDAKTGPSPVDALISALASCTAVDVVDILAKRRTPLSALSVEAVGQRAETIPRRVTAVTMTYHLSGDNIDRVHAERAIGLAIGKYCSVRDSLDPAMPVHYRAVINGEAGELRDPRAASAEG
ncbi:MAG: OsmC family protein [Gemmatimonadota bacterium]